MKPSYTVLLAGVLSSARSAIVAGGAGAAPALAADPRPR